MELRKANLVVHEKQSTLDAPALLAKGFFVFLLLAVLLTYLSIYHEVNRFISPLESIFVKIKFFPGGPSPLSHKPDLCPIIHSDIVLLLWRLSAIMSISWASPVKIT